MRAVVLMTPTLRRNFDDAKIFHHLNYAIFARKDLMDNSNATPMTPLLEATVNADGPPRITDMHVIDIATIWAKSVRRVVFYTDLGWDEDMRALQEYLESRSIPYVIRWIGKGHEKIK